MRRYTRRVLTLALGLLAVFIVARLLMGGNYRTGVTWHPLPGSDSLPAVRTEDPEIVRIENIFAEGDRLYIDVAPLKKGKTALRLLGQNGETMDYIPLVVDRFRTVYNEETGGFTGDIAVMILLTVFLLAVSAMMLHGFRSAKGSAFYAYSTVFYIGFFFFALLTGLTMLNITLRHLVMREEYSMLSVYYSLCNASPTFLLYTSPLLVIFCLSLAVSNIALLRHNRPRIQNVLGLLVSVLFLFGGAFGLWLSHRNFVGSVSAYRLHSAVENVYCTVYVYFECILAGAAVCAVKAARHCPPEDRDVIIILGCWFREDGSLPPLLRGRVDRALEYWRRHLAQTGRKAYLIPSGGQGKNESMPEAEAMKAYLIDQGIPEELILPETRSADTLQNLSFSRKIMEENGLSGDVIFSTTNYHVFRSGLWAAEAGLRAEGIGSRTKWWFWPNAFIREWISLIVNRWKQELVLLVLLAFFFGLLSMTIIG